MNPDDLDSSFFKAHPVECARRLIGAEFRWDGCAGRIVETEAYAAEDDPACHTFFRPSARSFVEEKPPGAAYVYLNYGVHWLFNVLVKGGEVSGFVLFRALEPIEGLSMMQTRRSRVKEDELCSGPGRLTQALGISGEAHGAEFLSHEARGIRLGQPMEVLSGPRIGISRGTGLQWRFGAPRCLHLSRRF
ncbi:DNA-3-methyladenine glycosylase [Haloferula sp. A504]|uniref:DNA-3-methyladenine glycosylase n=1 Tax=Haloferula sp. A504 TaxID=3373601 RepID=UPI0031C1FD53|nr:DNA-3-methyladenine glycosylase [Verrucomicrobiaceae bacterium E54]